MTRPEDRARERIDQRLAGAGWLLQDVGSLNPGAARGLAVREYPTDSGPADYVLLVDRQLVGVIEAKRDDEGERLTVHEHSEVSPEHVENCLKSAVRRARLIERAKWAVNQASINQQCVCRTPIPVPPFEEQLEVVRLLEGQLIGTAGQNGAIEKSLAMAAAQRQYILRAAFSGHLAPQNPNDEPTRVLLERIRQQCDATPQAARRQHRAGPSVAA